MPSAEKWAGRRGTTTVGRWSSRAISQACSGPAPPKATKAKSRGSKPRSTEMPRMASDILATAMRTMPSAASITESPLGHAAPGPLGVQGHLPAQEPALVDPPEEDVGVGHRGLDPSPAIADRAGVPAGALRPHLERADLVDPGDAAPTRPYLYDVDDRQHDRVPTGIAADVVALGDARHVALDQAGLGRRAPHVEGDDVLEPQGGPHGRGGDDAPDRARLHHRHRDPLRGVG